MRLLRRAVALILVIVVAAVALVPPVAALDEMRLPILDVITKLSNAWGGFDPESIYCYNCGGEVTLKQLEEYDGGLAGAICPYCSKSLMFDSGTFPIGGFKGFDGGQSRGGSVGRWDDFEQSQIDSEKLTNSQAADFAPSGRRFYPTPIHWNSNIQNDDSVIKKPGIFLFPDCFDTSTYFCSYNNGIRDWDVMAWYWTPEYTGYYQFYLSASVWPSESGGYFAVNGDNLNSFSWNQTFEPFYAKLGQKYTYEPIMSDDDPNYVVVQVLHEDQTDGHSPLMYYNYELKGYLLYLGDEFAVDDVPGVVDTGNKTIIVNGDTVSYNTIYESGDTYIIYQQDKGTSPAIVYVKDPQTGEVIGMSWYDPSGNCYYYTDFTAPDPTPTPAPTSVPGPTATPGPGPTATPDPGGDGGDGGDDGSGGGIWDTIAQGIADFIGVLGKLLGGILSGFVNLLTELVGSLTAVVPLIENISGVLSGLYSFLPESWQLLLNSAFTFLLVFAVVKLVLGFGK